MKELVSIIIPVYNAKQYINRCLESVFSQILPEYEVVVVDDGSTDGTKEVLQMWSGAYKQLKIYHTAHLGVSAARNIGLEQAEGRYIAFVDADDEIAPQYLEILYGLIKKHRAQLAACGLTHVNGTKSYAKNSYRKRHIKGIVYTGKEFLERMEEPLRYEKTAVCWNKLYDRRIFEGKSYPEGRIYEDSAIMQDILYPIKKLVETDEVLYFYHTESLGITRSAYDTDKLDEVVYAKRRMIFFRQKQERYLYVLARKQYCISLLKHYYLLKHLDGNHAKTLEKLQKEQKRYLKGFGWKKKLPLKVAIVFEAGIYMPYLCGALVVWWDAFLEKRCRREK